jgi:hypothetical protein
VATRSQQEARLAETREATILIDTHTIQAHGADGTFVVVWGQRERLGLGREASPTMLTSPSLLLLQDARLAP